MKLIATLIFTLLPIVASAQSTNRDSLDEAILLAKENAFYASRVDWKNIEAEATRLLLSPKGGEDAAITYVARSLGDGHSFYRPKRPDNTIKQSEPPKTRPPIAVFEGLDGSVPIISINSWSGGGPDMQVATMRVRTALERAIALNSCGLILDFSQNGGGNMWPMASGLIPLLSEGVLGYFRDRNGNDVSIERSKDRILIADQPLGSYGGRAEEITAPKRIAIIIGPNSISSGEIVPILFLTQNNVKFFGANSSGVNSANSSFTLKNGATLALTSGITLDRNKTPMLGPIAVDQLSTTPRSDAARWIEKVCK